MVAELASGVNSTCKTWYCLGENSSTSLGELIKISEKQLHQLIFYANGVSVQYGSLTDDGRETLRKLLHDIREQQSEDLKDIE